MNRYAGLNFKCLPARAQKALEILIYFAAARKRVQRKWSFLSHSTNSFDISMQYFNRSLYFTVLFMQNDRTCISILCSNQFRSTSRETDQSGKIWYDLNIVLYVLYFISSIIQRYQWKAPDPFTIFSLILQKWIIRFLSRKKSFIPCNLLSSRNKYLHTYNNKSHRKDWYKIHSLFYAFRLAWKANLESSCDAYVRNYLPSVYEFSWLRSSLFVERKWERHEDRDL